MTQGTRSSPRQGSASNKENFFYDKGTMRIVIFACAVIVLSVICTGFFSYVITRSAVVEKLKTRDLVYIIQSISAKIDGRISRARETALLLARDPLIIDWVNGAERDVVLGGYAQKKLSMMAEDYGYVNAAIVSATTNQYWAENAAVIQIMKERDPHSQWFFDTLRSGKSVDLNLDYDKGRKGTYAFVNALMGDVHRPIAVASLGIDLGEVAGEFRSHKFGAHSRLWMINSRGEIYFSDDEEHNGRSLGDFLPAPIFTKIMEDSLARAAVKPKVTEYENADGVLIDLAYQEEKSGGWTVVFQMPRSEIVTVLDTIKFNTLGAGLLTLLVMIFVFYIISHKIADPLKRAVQLTKEMKKQVSERTRELAEKNRQIFDSIEYAKKLQESSLVTTEELRDVFYDYFILWMPRDIVGGDFYWIRKTSGGKSFVALADCTGHGVPGALMTMTVNAVLNQIVNDSQTDPALILTKLDRRVKEILHRNNQCQVTDDGLDISLCCIEGTRLTFAGAKQSLYILRDGMVERFKGDKISIGYRNSPDDPVFTQQSWNARPGDQFYLMTDGYLDQNGGEKNYAFGRTRFAQLLLDQEAVSMYAQGEAFAQALRDYMGNETQRDDITLIGFLLK